MIKKRDEDIAKPTHASRRRRDEMNALAKACGYDSHDKMMTSLLRLWRLAEQEVIPRKDAREILGKLQDVCFMIKGE